MTISTNDVFSATHTARLLLNDYSSGNLSHAYMLIGNTSAGKRTLSRAFAQLIMCEAPHGTTPCGECSSCRYFDSFGEHPNMTVVSLGNKASIKVDDIREMSDGIYTAPYIGTKKIYIIENAEKMTLQAQNALLKILEEPPEYVVFFLLTANRYAMLQTVMSRCRTLCMSLYSESALRNIALSSAPELSAAQTDILIHRSQGLPGKLISLLNSDEEERNGIFSAVTALLNNDIETIFSAAEKIDSRETALSFVNSINEIMRDASVYMVCRDEKMVFNADKTAVLESIAEKATLKQIVNFLSESMQTVKMLSGNVSYQLSVKNLLMKW